MSNRGFVSILAGLLMDYVSLWISVDESVTYVARFDRKKVASVQQGLTVLRISAVNRGPSTFSPTQNAVLAHLSFFSAAKRLREWLGGCTI